MDHPVGPLGCHVGVVNGRVQRPGLSKRRHGLFLGEFLLRFACVRASDGGISGNGHSRMRVWNV